ncbi:hypothetical protein L484_006807 [Morus notabilis]|uniref:RNase H type-1 domain-containing protein n=1 Tax=Morus notabilis TaxID=981085 RepID=W9RGF1_9ROSA|nr:hypothetical protein L484_006807 [Morus notabilis]
MNNPHCILSRQRKSGKPQDSGKVKINIDASVKENVDYLDRGIVIIRDEGCNVLAAASKCSHGGFHAHIGECLAVRERILFAQANGFLNCVVEIDAVNLVNAVSKPNLQSSDLNVIGDLLHQLSQALLTN